ncbi:MAG: ribosome small subunit-dependent GTPase A [Planctomycetales bacterium]|nr:ribosome small subunit-dependent GTPase A [Planctomycetales bacterium]
MSLSALNPLGWKPCFELQLTSAEMDELMVVRIGAHFGSQVLYMTDGLELSVPTSLTESCGELAVGDWLLVDPETHRGVRRLERESLIKRKAAGQRSQTQWIAANVDTLFIVSSCNHDFNLSRLERYLAVANEACVNPVVVLTKSDLCDDPHSLQQQASRLMAGLLVEFIDARDSSQAASLAIWCGQGQTVGLVGSSGVGKSTLATSLGAGPLETQPIREDDSKGRHTTTTRSIHRLDAGGVLIDTPGMRELQLAECEQGVDEVFEEIVLLAQSCHFRDCKHQYEPGCAIQDAIDQGRLDPRRLSSYRKLQSEQARNTQSLREQRHQSRKRGRFFKSVLAEKRQRHGNDR